MEGDSRFMPSASDLAEIHLPAGQVLRVSGADLEPCYHAVPVSLERALANPIGPPISEARLAVVSLTVEGCRPALYQVRPSSCAAGRCAQQAVRAAAALPLRGMPAFPCRSRRLPCPAEGPRLRARPASQDCPWVIMGPSSLFIGPMARA